MIAAIMFLFLFLKRYLLAWIISESFWPEKSYLIVFGTLIGSESEGLWACELVMDLDAIKLFKNLAAPSYFSATNWAAERKAQLGSAPAARFFRV